MADEPGHDPVHVQGPTSLTPWCSRQMLSARFSVGRLPARVRSFGDNLVTVCTKMQQSNPKVSPIHSLKSAVSYT
jgi:hypothetical protein